MSRILKAIKNPKVAINYLKIKSLTRKGETVSDEKYLRKVYKIRMGKKLDLKNPQTFNEKLQWLKLNNRTNDMVTFVDKYKVRDYISQVLGEEYLIPLLGVWDSPEEIDFDSLPDMFVLKCNHNSGLGMCICKNKQDLDLEKVKSELAAGLAQNYYLYGREWPYKDVPRKIIAEKFMEESDGAELKDYKIHCFNGEPKFILVCSDRFTGDGLREDFYDIDWNLLEFRRPNNPNSISGSKKPDKILEMLAYARLLAKDLPFVRIDFYEIDSRVYFGEITFFPASGFTPFEPEEWDEILGGWIDLPKKQIK